MLTVYGLKNCDTCRKALKWLKGEGLDHKFHDLRTDGLSEEKVGAWLKAVPADKLVNRKSTTWRSLSDAEKARADGPGVAALLADNPSLVKRPVIDTGSDILVGWTDIERDRLA